MWMLLLIPIGRTTIGEVTTGGFQIHLTPARLSKTCCRDASAASHDAKWPSHSLWPELVARRTRH